LAEDARPSLMLVPEGVAGAALAGWAGRAFRRGDVIRHGSLTLQAVPFLDQTDYDLLLWCSDLNFVRGEDSVVRAQWAQKPFVWHIYPQQENAHRIKLDAFLDRFVEGLVPDAARACRSAWHAWNGDGDMGVEWPAFREALPALHAYMPGWSAQLRRQGNLAANLMAFIRSVGQGSSR
jgi:uncharacterized repeat protein (TIGR03837 family)